MPRTRRFVLLVAAALVLTVAAAVPAGAQQLVDAGREGDGSGGLAFVLMVVLVFFTGASLFFMDRVRRRRGEQ